MGPFVEELQAADGETGRFGQIGWLIFQLERRELILAVLFAGDVQEMLVKIMELKDAEDEERRRGHQSQHEGAFAGVRFQSKVA